MNDTDRAEIDARATAIVRRALEAGLEGVQMTAFVDPECASANGYRNALTALDALETAAVETALAPQPAAQATHAFMCGGGSERKIDGGHVWAPHQDRSRCTLWCNCALEGCGHSFNHPCHSEAARAACGILPMGLANELADAHEVTQPASEAGREVVCPRCGHDWRLSSARSASRTNDGGHDGRVEQETGCDVPDAPATEADRRSIGEVRSSAGQLPITGVRTGRTDSRGPTQGDGAHGAGGSINVGGQGGVSAVAIEREQRETLRECQAFGSVGPFVPDPGSSFADGGPEILDTLADIEKGVVADPRVPVLPEIETVAYEIRNRSNRDSVQWLGWTPHWANYDEIPLTLRTTAQAYKDAYERAENGAAKEQMRAITAERALAAATAEVGKQTGRAKQACDSLNLECSQRGRETRRADKAEAERDAMKSRADQLQREQDAAIAARGELAAELASARTERDTLRAERDGARGELARIRAQEPVAWRSSMGSGTPWRYSAISRADRIDTIDNYGWRVNEPLYALPPDSITRAEHEALRQRFENACAKITRLESEHEAECLALFEGNATAMAAFSKQAVSTHAAALAAAREAGALAMREACVELLRGREGTWAKKRVEFGDFESAAKSYYARQNEAEQSATAVAALPAPAPQQERR